MKKIHKRRKVLKHILQLYYFLTNFQKSIKNASKWQKCDFAQLCVSHFTHFEAKFIIFFKILHKIWKNLIFLPLISYFMTYHSKTNIKVWKFKNKLFRPNFNPFCMWIHEKSKFAQSKFLKISYPTCTMSKHSLRTSGTLVSQLSI